MSKLIITLHNSGQCHICHEVTNAEIVTDMPLEYGGKGRSFCSTDLVAAALGSCVLTSIENILEREGYDSRKVTISVTKTLSNSPKMIKSMSLEIFYPEKLHDTVVKKLDRAIAVCTVKRSLNEQVTIDFKYTQA